MPNSMTGYGRARRVSEGFDVTVEIKSVNNRFFDLTVKAPRAYGFLEELVRSELQPAIARGKTEAYVSLSFTAQGGGESVSLVVNEALLKTYTDALSEISEKYPVSYNVNTLSLLNIPDMVSVVKDEISQDDVWAAVKPVLDEALALFLAKRAAEGQTLAADLLAKCENIEKLISVIKAESEGLVKQYSEKLVTKIQDLIGEMTVDPQRILTEAAIFADRTAIDEELVRLGSHIGYFKQLLAASEPIGKKMDFTVQEMNREINTIGSKIMDVDISRIVIDVKNELEKIREQIQNIE